jgi:aldehyde dehydrogenase (NAD+)
VSTPGDDPRAALRQLGLARPLIDGAWLDQTSFGEVDHTDPATGKVNGTIALCGSEPKSCSSIIKSIAVGSDCNLAG